VFSLCKWYVEGGFQKSSIMFSLCNDMLKRVIETAKNCILFGCIQINFLLNRMIWFGLQFWFYQPNRNITKSLIKYISLGPILLETQWNVNKMTYFSLLKFLLCFFFQKCIYVLLELLENDKKFSLLYFLHNMITFCPRLNLVYVVGNFFRWK